MMTRVPQLLVGLLRPVLGAARAELAIARAWAVFYLVYYYVSAHYARALLGIVWLILTPLLFLAVYVPILTHVFRGELPGATGPYDYALFMISGFLPWTAFSEGFGQGAASIALNPGVVRHAPIPPALLPLIRVAGAFAGVVVGVAVLLPVLIVMGRSPGLRLVVLPPAVLLLFGFTLGVSWLASSLAVFVRDVLQVLPTLLLIEFFACPVVYHPSLATGRLHTIVAWNPMTPFLALFRAALAPTAELAWHDLGAATAWTVGALVVGAAVFRRCEGDFGDAL